jgi:hypothetical protein
MNAIHRASDGGVFPNWVSECRIVGNLDVESMRSFVLDRNHTPFKSRSRGSNLGRIRGGSQIDNGQGFYLPRARTKRPDGKDQQQ